MTEEKLHHQEEPAIDVAIIGGGIIGLCCAIQLLSQQRQVTIFEPKDPASGCSSGNAGHFATEQVIPLANPSTLLKLPSYLFSSKSALSIKYRYLPKMIPWLMRFLHASLPHQQTHATKALSSLNQHAMPAWSSLLKDTGLENLVKLNGSYLAMESAESITDFQKTAEILLSQNISFDVLDANQTREKLPILGNKMEGAIYFRDTAHTVNPLRLGQALAKLFIQRGGKITAESVKSVNAESSQRAILKTTQGRYFAKTIVIAAGAFSKQLVQQTGYKVPLDTERGYHLMLPSPGVELQQPVTFYERQFIATPMEHGLRLAGTVEFGGLDLPASENRLRHLHEHVKKVLPNLNTQNASTWMGFRPTLPDYLPIISRSPRNKNLLYAFGHQHLGLTQAAITGQLIAELALGKSSEIDFTPFRIDRF